MIFLARVALSLTLVSSTIAAEIDAPYVPALPSTTPEEALSRLRAAVAGNRDDQALGEAYDFLRRYPEDKTRAEVSLAAAALHLRREEPKRALKLLQPLAAPGADAGLRSRALHLLGAALVALEREEEILAAVPAADPASASDRWLAAAQIWRAAALERTGRLQEAGELYRAIAASGVESPVRAYALAAIAADWDRQGKPGRARDTLARAQTEAARWGLNELRDTLTLAAANEFSRERRLADAAKAYADFVRRFPSSPLIAQAYYERGLALKRLERKEDAAASFESLLKRAPDSVYAADAHLQLGQLDTELGLIDEALAHYRKMAKASEAKDADREALLLMAQVYYNAKRWRDAIPLYRRYLTNASADAKTKEVQGLLLVSLWSNDRADPEIARLAAKIPEHPLVAQIRWSLAADAYQRGNWAAAADLFRRQIEADSRSPRTAEARFYRAEALRQLGKAADAADAYRRFLAQDPKGPRAKEAALRLGALLYESGDAAGAADAYGRVTGTDATAANALYALGRLRERLKQTRAAKAAYEKLKGVSPKDDPARLAGLLRLALLLELEDKSRAAAPLYAEIMKHAKRGSSMFETARKRLEALTKDKSLIKGQT